MLKFIILFTFSTGLLAQEVPLFSLADGFSSGIPTNPEIISNCTRPGESKSFEDMDPYLDSLDEKKPASDSSGATIQ